MTECARCKKPPHQIREGWYGLHDGTVFCDATAVRHAPRLPAQEVVVVAESYGATAVVEVFNSWALAIAYARTRFANFSQCADRTSMEDFGNGHATYAASWDPGTNKPDVARRVDIAVWTKTVQTEPR